MDAVVKPSKRSRFHAQPSGKKYRVSEHDVIILKLLQRYRYLPSTYIKTLLGLDGHYYQEVLTRLRHDKELIECPPSSWAAANARYRPAVYALSKKGDHYLKHHGFWEPHTRLKKDFAHELMVCLYYASIEIGAKQHDILLISPKDLLDHPRCPRERFQEKKPWAVPASFTLDGQDIEKTIETDGAFFGLANPEASLTIIVPGTEQDRKTEPLDPEDKSRANIRVKFAAQRAAAKRYLYEKRYGIDRNIPLFIPYVTINETRQRSIIHELKELTGGAGSTLFGFTHIPNFAAFENFPPPTDWALRTHYARVGYEDFNFLKALGKEVS